MTKFEIIVDDENNAEEFWDAIASHGGGAFAKPINALLRGNMVTVTAEEKDQLLSHLSGFAGWSSPEAPEYASQPVFVRKVQWAC